MVIIRIKLNLFNFLLFLIKEFNRSVLIRSSFLIVYVVIIIVVRITILSLLIIIIIIRFFIKDPLNFNHHFLVTHHHHFLVTHHHLFLKFNSF